MTSLDLSEHLKQLDYPNHFSISSIYTPYGSAASFQIVANILQWLAGRLEPDTILPGGTDTEGERVLLIRSAAEFFVTKTGIKLNPRRLYASSASTATELLKVTALLLTAPSKMDGNDEATIHASTIDLGDKVVTSDVTFANLLNIKTPFVYRLMTYGVPGSFRPSSLTSELRFSICWPKKLSIKFVICELYVKCTYFNVFSNYLLRKPELFRLADHLN